LISAQWFLQRIFQFDHRVSAHAGGRPSKFRKVVKTFLDQIRAGLTIEAAAGRSGITGRCVHYWLERGRAASHGEFFQFFQSYTRARGEALADMIKEIRSAGREDWRATAWLAERMFKEELSLKQQHELSGPDGGPVSIPASVPVTLKVDEKALALGDCQFQPADSFSRP